MKRKLLILLLTLFLLYAIGGVVYHFLKTPTNNPAKPKQIDEIKGYDYKLHEGATKLMKDEFQILKKNLESGEIDEAAYAEAIAKLFIIDLYTISNKLNKYDVGGMNYVFPAAVDNYKLNVKDTIYKYVEDNIDGKRKQTLPEVKSINMIEIAEIEETIAEKKYQAYKISLEWTYINDLGYDKTGDITLVKVDKHYYVSAKN